MNTAANLLYLDTALALAHSAGALLMQGAHARQPAQSKSVSTDLVTQYDAAAEELIATIPEAVLRTCPGYQTAA